jgi:hypothetical protein
MEFAVSSRSKTNRKWISGLAVTLTTIIAYMAFWRLAPVATFIIGCAALMASVIAAWWFGKEANQSRER